MKRRPLLLVLGSLLLLVVALLAVVRLPATQRWLLLRAVADVPGLELKVESVSAGLTGAELRGVEANYQGTSVRLPLVQARYAGWTMVTKRELVVGEFVATGAEVVLAGSSGPGAAPAQPGAAVEQAFAGFLAPLQLPLKATIDAVRLGGRVQLSATQTVKFSVQGRLLLPGEQATTDIHVEWADTAEGAAAARLDWVGRLATKAAADGAINRLELNGSLAAPATKPGAPEHGLATVLAVARGTDGVETVTADIRLSTAKPTDEPVARLNVVHKPGGAGIEGEWGVKLRREQLEGVADLNQLPDFTSEAKGSFKFAAASGDFTTEGRATAGVSKLQRVRRELAAMGALTGTLDFAIERMGDELRFARLDAAVNDARGPVVKLAALQPVGYRLDTQAMVFAQPDKDLARLEFGGLPLAWAQPWLGDTTLGGAISAGELRLKGAGGRWSVETARPLVFAGVRYGSAGKTVAEQLGGDLALRAAVDGAAWTVDALDLNFRPGVEGAIGAVSLKLAASQDAAGRGRVVLPLTLENGGRRSQLRLEGEWSLAADAKTVKARLGGDTVYLKDLVALAAFAPSASAPAAPAAGSGKAKAKTPAAAPRGAAKDEHPFWAGFDGRVDIDFKRLVLETEEVSGLQASLVCDAQKLGLEKLVARTKNAPLDAKVAVTFDPARSAPYALQGSCAFPGFDLGAWMRAANPGEEPAIETVLDVNAQLEGQGANLDDLLNNVRGDFVLKGGPGVLRIKDKRVEAASALGGLVLGLLSKEKQKPVVAAGAQLIEEMREFRFERIDVSLQRAEDLDLGFRMIDIRSAEKRLSGTGLAKHVAGRTINDYPLELEMRLAGKENFAAMLDEVKLLDGTKDGLGYLVVRTPFSVTGTVGEPNWKKMLAMFGAGLVLGK